MIELTTDFYRNLDIKIPKKFVKRAVESLTMPDFAYIYNEERVALFTKNEIQDHRALATVVDAVCEAFLMIKKYKDDSTMASLTFDKSILQNNQLNKVGKRLLKNKLFAYNNNLKENNTKDYATAFEAIIGFISLIDIKRAFKILDLYLIDYDKD